MLLFLGVIVAAILFIYLKLYKPMQKWKELEVQYIKPLIPIVGNMGTFLLRQTSVADGLNDMYNTFDSRYIGFFQFTTPILILKDLELIKQIGIKDFDHFVDHRKFISETDDAFWGRNLVNLRGQNWRNMRSTLSPAFTGNKMRSMFALMNECAEQFANYFKEETKNGQSVTVEMKDILTRFTNDVIATCAFGITCDSMKERNNQFYEMGKDASNFGGIRMLKFFGYSLFPSLMKMFNIKIFNDDVNDFFRNIITSNIKSREEHGIIRPDMIHLLMEARKGTLKHEDIKEEDAGFSVVQESDVGKTKTKQFSTKLSDDDITAQALLFVIGGFDTISIGACHMAYELALNEDVQQKLQQEIDLCKGKFTYDSIIQMKYLDMVVSETLRKWPPFPVLDRSCTDSYTIPAQNPGEHPIHMQKDDVVWFPTYALQHDPKYFPNPEKFDPERFNDENKINIQPLSYIPFGVGPRNCIASRFALLEMKVLFCHMLSKFNFVICDKSQVPLKLTKKTFNLNAENGFWLAIKPRK